MQYRQYRLFYLFMMLTILSCSPNAVDWSPVKVEIVPTPSGYQLMRGGEPYTIKGAGMAIEDIEAFAAHGGNSIRNWSTTGEYQDVTELLDAAHANGITVALCLSLHAERWGFDYNDDVAVAAQLAYMREEVLKYRDHPALLVWIIGNELNHSYTNPKVFDAINDVAAMIHELDPNHPTTTALAGFDANVVAEIETRAPALDFLSFQTYGSLFGLPGDVAASGFDSPFMVTEWGTVGYWEMQQTTWGAPQELTSSEKADTIMRAYRESLATFEGQLIGSYVFFWGQKQERTPTWFGMLTEDGEETEVVDAMHHLWTDTWPGNRTPRVNSILLDGQGYKESVMLSAGETYEAVFDVVDFDDDPLEFFWEVKAESDSTETGGDFEEALSSLEGLISDPASATTTITVPEPGRYRLFAWARDGQGHAAHANIPFLVEGSLLAGEVMAVAYSGFRKGQHPDRGDGAVNPTDEQILEDLKILVTHDLSLIRLYDSEENSAATLRLIREHNLPIKVLLGAWLRAEFSNHEGCAWLDEPIPDEELAANTLWNAAELQRAIELANEYEGIVVAVNVGNEALVDWNDHMVPVEQVIAYVRQVKAAIEQPVTVADNYEWWIRDGAELAAEVDFLGVHTYPVWEEKTIDEGIAYTIANIDDVRAALPDRPIAILEAGWATTASEFGERANEANQLRYYQELEGWAKETNITVFFFEAFDEPWKGDEHDPHGAEKHWGLFFVDRTPKRVVRELLEAEQAH